MADLWRTFVELVCNVYLHFDGINRVGFTAECTNVGIASRLPWLPDAFDAFSDQMPHVNFRHMHN